MIKLNEAAIDYSDPVVQKDVMLEYLQVMIAREDWPGVADAALYLDTIESAKNAANSQLRNDNA